MLTSELEAFTLSKEVRRLRRRDQIKTVIIYILLGLLVAAGIIVAAALLAATP